MVLAEKFVTAVWRGTANTRWRDFADIYLLACRHDVHGAELRSAIVKVAYFRQVSLVPLGDVLDGFQVIAQSSWIAWLRRQRLSAQFSERFDQILEFIIGFADPALLDSVGGKIWRTENRQWEEGSR